MEMLPDTFMRTFLLDMKQALMNWDERIRAQYLSSPYKDTFYKDYYKGIGTWSVTEPIIKFLVYVELLPKYKIRPEDYAYSNKKILDLALYTKLEDHSYISEIGIELKWARFKKNGLMYQASLQSLINDFVKMKALANEHKYFIQHAISDLGIVLDIENLNQQVLQQTDGRLLRTYIPELIAIESFEIWGASRETKKNFNLCLWKIHRK
ncbi:hypothetical protein NV379_17500 [Paenibacillus sp. N1-5-1-14]|uniref:hypothetical protein n=1 Tax=Paenibacillus radicibacter TaxID=2972488 RepID=UPI0021599455|nr:hypothetical protein [Paenibacillus radicibacter]MCR8644453.1 hypothetical protein [Paenibacillus radicibacter]